MQWPHCEQREGLSARSISQCKSPLLVRRVRAPALEPLAREMLTKSVKNPNAALNRPFARMELRNPARVEFALQGVLVAVLARVVRGDLTLTRRALRKPTHVATDPARAAAGELGKRLQGLTHGAKNSTRASGLSPTKSSKADFVRSTTSEADTAATAARPAKRVVARIFCARFTPNVSSPPSLASVQVQAYECGRGWSESKEEFAAARRGIQRVRRVNLFSSLSTWQYCKL